MYREREREILMMSESYRQYKMRKYPNILLVVVFSHLCFVSSFFRFHLSVPFNFFENFNLSEGITEPTEPVISMELQKQSNGNHHHDAAVPTEGGYVSYVCPTMLTTMNS